MALVLLNPKYTLVSSRNRYVCVVVPKVCSTTVRRTLLAWECGVLIDDKSIDDAHTNLSHPTINNFTENEMDNFFKFGFVRNPYDRLFSVWKSKVLSDSDNNFSWLRDICGVRFRRFVEFIADNLYVDGHWIPQIELLLPDEVTYDQIIRFEEFNDFALLLEQLGAPDNIVDISRTVSNKSTNLNLRDFMTDDLEEVIYKLYIRDFLRFNYDRGIYA